MAVSSLVSCSFSNCRTSVSPSISVPSRALVSGAYTVQSSLRRDRKGHAAMSLVLAADYRVPDFDRWWAMLSGDLPRLPGLGAHHIVVYRSLEDSSRVFVTIGFRERPTVDALLRSPVMFSWFDSAGVEEIPPMFAGQVVEKLDLAPECPPTGPAVPAGSVIVAAIAPGGQPARLRDSVHAAASRIAASGVRRFWIYQALDDQAEVMILLQI